MFSLKKFTPLNRSMNKCQPLRLFAKPNKDLRDSDAPKQVVVNPDFTSNPKIADITDDVDSRLTSS